MDNIDKTSIRKPISKKDIKKLFKKLSLNIYLKRRSRAVNNRAKTDLLLSNDPFDVVKLIRAILIRKRDENINFSMSNKKDFQTCIQNLAKEIAIVKKSSFEKEKANLLAIIKKIKIIKPSVSKK